MFGSYIWAERGLIYHLEAISDPNLSFRCHTCAEYGEFYRLAVIYGQRVTGFTVYRSYLVRKWPDLLFRGHIRAEIDRIFRLVAVYSPRVAGFTVDMLYTVQN